MSDTPVELKYAYRLSAIRLQNFMAFEDTGWIELRPITLLFGRNSSGKSAIIRALLLLKQSLESRDANAPLIFSGAFVDLGSYYNAVHRHELKRDISFGFRLSRPPFEEPLPADSASEEEKRAYDERVQVYENSKAQWLRSSSELPVVNVDDSPLELHLTFGLVNESSPPILKSLAIYGYRTPDNGQPKAVRVFQMARRGDARWEPQSDVPLDYERGSIQHKQFSDGLWADLAPDLGSGCIPRRLWLPDAANFLQSDRPPDWQVVDGALEFFWEHLTTLLRGIVYLPPLRGEPQRYYQTSEAWVQALTNLDSPFSEAVNWWLAVASLGARIDVVPLSQDEGLLGVYLLEEQEGTSTNLRINLRDVGTGVAQTLPIIVGTMRATPGDLIIIEQPELHLHPEAQAAMADFFIAMSKPSVGLRFLLETHSSSIIYRMRRRIAETKVKWLETAPQIELRPTDLGAYFISRQDGVSVLEAINYNDDGSYAQIPDAFSDFFGTDDEQLYRLRDAQLEAES